MPARARAAGINFLAVAEGHLVFVWKPSGYELREREGEAPERGAEVEEDGATMRVTKVGASPLPGDSRRCVFVMPA